MRTTNEVDQLLAAEKSLFGVCEWVEEGPVAKISSSVVNASGVIIGGLSVRVSALVETNAQRGSAILLLDGLPVQRFSYKPDHSHVNGGAHPVPVSMRLKILPAGQSRIYRWAHNRAWPPPGNLPAGEVLQPEPPTLDSALKVFLESCGITPYLPDAPHRPKLEL